MKSIRENQISTNSQKPRDSKRVAFSKAGCLQIGIPRHLTQKKKRKNMLQGPCCELAQNLGSPLAQKMRTITWALWNDFFEGWVSLWKSDSSPRLDFPNTSWWNFKGFLRKSPWNLGFHDPMWQACINIYFYIFSIGLKTPTSLCWCLAILISQLEIAKPCVNWESRLWWDGIGWDAFAPKMLCKMTQQCFSNMLCFIFS